MDVAAISGAAIAKRLASCNPSARNRAVRVLTSWLAADPAAVSDADFIKIWKGLFYCIWHADKAPVQLDLINRLAGLLPSLPDSLAARYLDAFLATIRREWGGIDFLRLDKFYLLIRRFLRHLFLLLSQHSWDPTLTTGLITLLSEKSLLASDKYPAQGVNYHIAEIFLDELSDFLPVSPATLAILLEPFHSVLAQSPDKVMISKIRMNMFDRLLRNGTMLLKLESSGEHAQPGSEMEKLGKIALVMNFSKNMLDRASATETLQGNRKVLFGLHEGFLKLEKDLEKAGVTITIEPLCNGNVAKDLEKAGVTITIEPLCNGNVAKDLKGSVNVEMGSSCGDGGSVNKPSKKKRKKSVDSSDVVEKKSKSSKKNKTAKGAIPNGSSDMESNVIVPNDLPVGNGEAASGDGDGVDGHNLIEFDGPVISNLQKQFEKVAEEAGMTSSNTSSSNLSMTPDINITKKKRKRAKSVDKQITASPSSPSVGSIALKSGEKSSKKVSFSMKNNIVWKPQTPLPPQSLRLPPSATPRGSALKKGIPPGPVRLTPMKKGNSKSSSGKKKARKSLKAVVSPSVKRLRKKQGLSV